MLFMLCVSAALGAQQKVKTAGRSGRTAALHYLEGRLHRYERETWYWQRLTGSPRTDTAGRTLAAMAISDLERTVRVWQRRDLKAHRLAQHPPHMNEWMCIHHYEGAWNDDTGNGYYGGLQMDLGFQRRYGSDLLAAKGPANRWTPLEQMWVAERALGRGRSFRAWPRSAALCGLL